MFPGSTVAHDPQRMAPRAARRPPSGFTLIELTVVLVLSGLTLGFASISFGGYLNRVSAQRAAQVFALDLTLARSAALRARQPVVVRFDETARWYAVVMQSSGREIVRRRFGVDGDIDLSGIDLRMDGDTVLFNARGVASLNNALGTYGEARFASNDIEYKVSFNAMGASEVEEN